MSTDKFDTWFEDEKGTGLDEFDINDECDSMDDKYHL